MVEECVDDLLANVRAAPVRRLNVFYKLIEERASNLVAALANLHRNDRHEFLTRQLKLVRGNSTDFF